MWGHHLTFSHGALCPQGGVGPQVAGDGRLGDAPHVEVLPQVPQVVGVGVAVVLLTPSGPCLHVDIIPGDCVLHPCSHAPEKKYEVLTIFLNS